MPVDRRKRNMEWYAANLDGRSNLEQARLAVLMDIRDELRTLNRLAQCSRIPRALNAVIELGAEARRGKRNAAKRRSKK